jgi:Helix-turn-helix domain
LTRNDIDLSAVRSVRHSIPDMDRDSPDRALPDPAVEPTITVPRAARILGISRNTAYAAAREGRLPTLAVSPNRVVVPTAEFLERYHLRPAPRPVLPVPPARRR